jgi:NAD-dependent deacetylase
VKIVVLTGAGMSAESGIPTFRGADGLWEGHRIEEVASPEGWATDREKVLRFYNERRRQILSVQPNAGHKALAQLQDLYDVHIITQNIDDLHERAGSRQVMHLHGEILKSRSSGDDRLIYDCRTDIQLHDTCEKGYPLRPHIVWFGEMVPMMDHAAAVVQTADILVIIGTSMVVYPAASLLYFAPPDCPVYIINPEQTSLQAKPQYHFIMEPASSGVSTFIQKMEQYGK